jgi:hypothetical protein
VCLFRKKEFLVSFFFHQKDKKLKTLPQISKLFFLKNSTLPLQLQRGTPVKSFGSVAFRRRSGTTW